VRSANSIAAYNHTVGISLLEAAAQANQEQLPVLVTLFDLAARGLYSQVFAVDRDFAAALVISPVMRDRPPIATLTFSIVSSPCTEPAWMPSFAHLRACNPAARVLPLLHALAGSTSRAEASCEFAADTYLKILIEK
jgi:hypothetical protein